MGIVDVMAGAAVVSDTKWTHLGSKLDFLPAGGDTRAFAAGDILASDKLDKLFKALRGAYDCVIVDLPSVAPYADVRTASHMLDSLILRDRFRACEHRRRRARARDLQRHGRADTRHCPEQGGVRSAVWRDARGKSSPPRQGFASMRPGSDRSRDARADLALRGCEERVVNARAGRLHWRSRLLQRPCQSHPPSTAGAGRRFWPWTRKSPSPNRFGWRTATPASVRHPNSLRRTGARGVAGRRGGRGGGRRRTRGSDPNARRRLDLLLGVLTPVAKPGLRTLPRSQCARDPDSRRLRLHPRFSGRAFLPRQPAQPDPRGRLWRPGARSARPQGSPRRRRGAEPAVRRDRGDARAHRRRFARSPLVLKPR